MLVASRTLVNCNWDGTRCRGLRPLVEPALLFATSLGDPTLSMRNEVERHLRALGSGVVGNPRHTLRRDCIGRKVGTCKAREPPSGRSCIGKGVASVPLLGTRNGGSMASILVVDDEDGVRSAYEAVLRHDGHRVYAASTAGQALQLLDRTRPDLVLLDIKLSEWDPTGGIAVLHRMRERQPAVRSSSSPPISTPSPDKLHWRRAPWPAGPSPSR